MMKIVYMAIVFLLIHSCHPKKDKRTKFLERVFSVTKDEIKGAGDDWDVVNTDIENITVADGRGIILNMSDFIDSVFYVPLQTTSNSLIGKIDKIYQDENTIIIVDKDVAKAIFIFDNAGKFLSKISKLGEGPDEYKTITDVTVDFSEKKVEVLDNVKRKIFSYDFKGTLKNVLSYPLFIMRIEKLSASNMLWFNDDELNSHIPQFDNYRLFMSNPNGEILKKAFQFEKRNQNFHYSNVKSMVRHGNSVYYTPRLLNLIFKIDSQRITPLYQLDLQGRGFADREIEDLTDNLYLERRNENDFFLFNGEYSINDTYVYGKIFNKKSIFCFFYNKREKESFVLSGLNTDIPDAVLFNFPYTGYKDLFIAPLQSFEVFEANKNLPFMEERKSKALSDLYTRIKVDDNPILMYYSLKGEIKKTKSQ